MRFFSLNVPVLQCGYNVVVARAGGAPGVRLKEQVARHCLRRSASGLHREKCRGTLVLPVEVSQRDQ